MPVWAWVVTRRLHIKKGHLQLYSPQAGEAALRTERSRCSRVRYHRGLSLRPVAAEP